MNEKKEKYFNRRRVTYSKKNLQGNDSDTSIDSEITYAESEDSMTWATDEDTVEIEQPDKDDMNIYNEFPTILVKDNTVKRNAIEEIAEHKHKVKILEDIRNTPENRVYFDLKRYGPFTKIDKDFDVFNTVRNLKENVINIYDNPVPSTSRYNEKQKNRIKIDVKHKTSIIKKRQIDNICTSLESMYQDLRDETDTIVIKSIEGRKKLPEIKNTVVVKELGENTKECSQTTRKINAKTEESNKLPEANLHTYLTINDSVLFRYFEKKSWVYYIGYIESLELKEQELFYFIRFLKTVKKPALKFIVTRKVDKDMVPAICIVKKVDLKYEAKEYLLSNENDQVYFD